jgi:ribose/xylose/arabinose/galactoside ABC-type transport system permease subunit
MKSITKLKIIEKLRKKALMVWMLVLMMFICSVLLSPSFLTQENISNILIRLSILFIAALAQMLVMVVGSIDLSIGAAISLSTCIASYLLPEIEMLGALAIISIGAIIGLGNGIGVTKLKINPFAMTLGMMLILQGICYIIRPYSGGSIPASFLKIWRIDVMRIPVIPLSIIIIMASVFWLLFNKTYIGIHLLSTGENEEVARRCGIGTVRLKVFAHIFCGCLGMLAGLLLAFRIEGGSPNIGTAYMLLSVASSTIGGVPLSGGETDIIGVFGASFLMILIVNILNLLSIPEATQWIIQAILILILLIITEVLRK